MKVHILHYIQRLNGGFDDFYPLYKYARLFEKRGISIKFFYDADKMDLCNADVVIIHVRFNFKSIVSKIELLNRLRDLGRRIILFDGFDTTGIPNFSEYHYFDRVIKKQILRDSGMYVQNPGMDLIRPWIENGNEHQSYDQPSSEDLNKLTLGWNIGLLNYRRSNSKLFNLFGNYSIRSLPRLFESEGKDINVAFRGETKYSEEVIGIQRRNIRSILSERAFPNSIIGGKTAYSSYINELSKSRISISPFGWGEICYRDFESFLTKSVLFKPDCSHFITFPDFFIPNETYVPFSWSLNDMVEKIEHALDEPINMKEIAERSYEKFISFHNQEDYFLDHFEKIIVFND